jgi:hypothetical protein
MCQHQKIALPCAEPSAEAHVWIFDTQFRAYLSVVSGDIGWTESWTRCR